MGEYDNLHRAVGGALLYKQIALGPRVVIEMEEVVSRNFRRAAVIVGVWSAVVTLIVSPVKW